jgi:hypothetical protein
MMSASFWQFLYLPGFRLGVSQLNGDLTRGSVCVFGEPVGLRCEASASPLAEASPSAGQKTGRPIANRHGAV